MNLIDDIIWRLAQLASLSFQERWVLSGATRDEYVLDVELLENMENMDGIKYRIRLPKNKAVLTDAQQGALEDLWAYIEAVSGDALSARSREEQAVLFRESVVWKTLRAKAGSALQLFGLPAEMSIAEINRRSGIPNLPH